MSQTKKSLQDLTLLDRFLFAEVMEDAETFENVLSIILGQDISIKGHPQSEHEKRTSPLKRQVRLDRLGYDKDSKRRYYKSNRCAGNCECSKQLASWWRRCRWCDSPSSGTGTSGRVQDTSRM